MFRSTVDQLRCPRRKGRKICAGELRLQKTDELSGEDVLFGLLQCSVCQSEYPVLAGVAVLVPDVRDYLLSHAKGVSRIVPDERIPSDLRYDFQEAREEIEAEGTAHIEEDLEADRVTALYLMTHYLQTSSGGGAWWQTAGAAASPAIEELIRKHWDEGPLARIAGWQKTGKLNGSWLEVGCGVGGLGARLSVSRYLGVDSSFASIALARHVVLGAEYPEKTLQGPRDLLEGQLAQTLPIRSPLQPQAGASIDYVVGDAESLPVQNGTWDVAASLNMIDMLEEPELLPRTQHALLKPGGVAIQSCPYIWHPVVARELRKRVPAKIRDSARAVEWLYEKAGLALEEHVDHVPWLFFKHSRQIELYSVHLMRCRKPET